MRSARCLVILFVTVVSTLHGQSSPLVDSLNQLYTEAWKFASDPRPLDTELNPDDPRLPDMRSDAIAFRSAYWSGIQRWLMKVDTARLTGDDLINYEVFRYIVNDNVARFVFRTYLMPFNAEGGFHTDFAFNALRGPFEHQEDYEKYLVKLRGFGEYVDEEIALMEQGIREGYTLPAVITEGFDKTVDPYLTKKADESPFYKPFLAMPGSIADPDELSKQGLMAIAESVSPGYHKLAEFLKKTYIPACRATIGASSLPDGKAYYAEQLRYYSTLDLTPQEIFDLGMQEVHRIHVKMEAIIDSLGYKGSFEQFLEFLRTDPQFYARTPHELLAEASYFCKRIDGKLPEYFGKLPRLPYGVEPVPAAIAPRYTGGRYSEGSYKEHRAGMYWVNTFMLESRPLYVLPSLTLHEAVPGHHLQISLAAEAENGKQLPEFRRDYYISAFGEGWALYAEWLGHEMGIYETLYQKFGALTYEMWRACRLVVDPGMHAMGWTRQQAVDFMVKNTALSMHEINTEVNRYIGWPGQAVSYKIGELTIQKLRTQAETALGEHFNIRDFHDTVLENGSLPLFVLERVVNGWIDTTSQQMESHN